LDSLNAKYRFDCGSSNFPCFEFESKSMEDSFFNMFVYVDIKKPGLRTFDLDLV